MKNLRIPIESYERVVRDEMYKIRVVRKVLENLTLITCINVASIITNQFY